ncbi:hypothetical protein V6N11_016314 [Hibiscus sabdariffa]|uniref:Uncharacterized protein n=1 Tax=Hibiscus sabdariffa TaxID=183260 RepID=A0ABR2TUL5_9ROSI
MKFIDRFSQVFFWNAHAKNWEDTLFLTFVVGSHFDHLSSGFGQDLIFLLRVRIQSCFAANKKGSIDYFGLLFGKVLPFVVADSLQKVEILYFCCRFLEVCSSWV